MPNNLCVLFDSGRHSRHRQPLPEYEKTHQFVINRQGMMCILSRQLPVDRILDGWVFYISVHSDDLEKAWRLIEKTLLTWNGRILGIEIPDLRNGPCPSHCMFGNQIKLFTFKDPSGELLTSPKEIFGILRRAENKLSEAGIKPGGSTSARQQITGSHYVSMRHDRDLANEYVPVDVALQINSANPHNPFMNENPYDWFNFMESYGRIFSQKRNLPGSVQSNNLVCAQII